MIGIQSYSVEDCVSESEVGVQCQASCSRKQVIRKTVVQAFYMHSPGYIKSTLRSGGKVRSG